MRREHMDSSSNNPRFILSLLVLLFFFLSIKTHPSFAADTLSAGESLTGNQTIISKDENFALGFFSPGKSRNFYIGIWYYKVSVANKTVVWVANREKPIKDSATAELRLLQNGNLVLIDQSERTPIWSTNSTSNLLNSTEAILGDDGNLVLRDGSNKSIVIWESFDNPTNTWLPGGKLGLNKRTNKNQLLTSWRNEEDPAPGIFSLELDPSGSSQYFIQWNKSQRYWSSGEWNGQIFSGVPEMRSNYIYNFNFINVSEESYFTYTIYDKSIVTRLVMDISGQIRQLSWLEQTKEWNLFWSNPRASCDVRARCGSFGICNQNNNPPCDCLMGFSRRFPESWSLGDTTGGCVRNTALQCGNKDGFLPMSNIKMLESSESLNQTRSIEECQSACSNKCSCNAYSYGSNTCLLFDGDLLNVQHVPDGDNTGGDVYLRLDASEIKNAGGGNKKKSITVPLVGAVVGVLALLSLVLILVIWRCKKRRAVRTSKSSVEGSLMAFTYRDLHNATKNFSDKLGGGGFGSVFKGVLSDSTVIAVKKLEGLSQGEKQFRSEVSTIGTIQHVNLVRLRGFCSEGAKRLLVYDYMAKGSLDAHLFHPKDSDILNWKTRYGIALGTARGLTYLHEKCRDCIIHCDIKPENILLDADFCPKVADFGLAKLVGREFSRVLTTMRGTRGYLAPEWISGVAITTKADVYSFGMMLFEIISGRRNSKQSEDVNMRFFPTWAATKLTEGEDILSIADKKLEGNADVEELTRACKVACWCIQDNEAHRPTMGQVVQILEGVLDVNQPPVPRSLHVLEENQNNVFFLSESTNRSSQAQSSTSSASSQAKSTTSSRSSKS